MGIHSKNWRVCRADSSGRVLSAALYGATEGCMRVARNASPRGSGFLRLSSASRNSSSHCSKASWTPELVDTPTKPSSESLCKSDLRLSLRRFLLFLTVPSLPSEYCSMALSTRLKLFVGLTGDESEASSRHKRRRGSRPRELVRDALDAALPTLEERLRLRDLFPLNGEELPRRGECRRPLPEVLPI